MGTLNSNDAPLHARFQSCWCMLSTHTTGPRTAVRNTSVVRRISQARRPKITGDEAVPVQRTLAASLDHLWRPHHRVLSSSLGRTRRPQTYKPYRRAAPAPTCQWYRCIRRAGAAVELEGRGGLGTATSELSCSCSQNTTPLVSTLTPVSPPSTAPPISAMSIDSAPRHAVRTTVQSVARDT